MTPARRRALSPQMATSRSNSQEGSRWRLSLPGQPQGQALSMLPQPWHFPLSLEHKLLRRVGSLCSVCNLTSSGSPWKRTQVLATASHRPPNASQAARHSGIHSGSRCLLSRLRRLVGICQRAMPASHIPGMGGQWSAHHSTTPLRPNSEASS